jgi:GT2 family glycosyltransferase
MKGYGKKLNGENIKNNFNYMILNPTNIFNIPHRAALISNYASITAACAILRKDLYFSAGGLNEKNLKVAFNDVDLCLKLLELGYRNVYTPFVELYHHESVSRGYDEFGEKRKRLIKESIYMHKKWKKYIKNDPFYNPNLSRRKIDFSIR